MAASQFSLARRPLLCCGDRAVVSVAVGDSAVMLQDGLLAEDAPIDVSRLLDDTGVRDCDDNAVKTVPECVGECETKARTSLAPAGGYRETEPTGDAVNGG
jgi:hypothetical protein